MRELTRIPTAAGHERAVLAWAEAWTDERPDMARRADAHGNVELRFADQDTDSPIWFAAHTDHPAFVVERVDGRTLELSFRGGVMDDYFPDAEIVLHGAGGPARATVTRKVSDEGDVEGTSFKTWAAELPHDAAVAPGDVATWSLPEQEVVDDEFGGILHTDACDDLAALAAALSAVEELRLARAAGTPVGDVRVLLTRAEEVGFIGAIGASRDAFMPKRSKIIALETSRSFADSPIHGGPIVRVGDRASVFTPELTAAVAAVARDLAGYDTHTSAVDRVDRRHPWRWQRRLMPGGACEASVYCAFGYQSTCVCLPLGNYHNMADLDAVQAKRNTTRPRVGREYIGLDDYFGMIDLLAACGIGLPERPSFVERIDKLWADRRSVLDATAAPWA